MILATYGGGTNSSAAIIEWVKKGLPIDVILFADTGGEKPHTYRYVKLFSDWLVSQGYPEIITVKRVNQKKEVETLEEECLRLENMPSIAFGSKTCSQKHKIAPQDKYMNNLPEAKEVWARGERIIKLIGYDIDEDYRIKPDQDEADTKYERRYPLIEYGMDRDDCIESIKSVGLPLPGKSACFFCPTSKPSEIEFLRDQYPELFERALKIEELGVKKATSVKGLGRTWSWKEATRQITMFDEDFKFVPEVTCGCFDG